MKSHTKQLDSGLVELSVELNREDLLKFIDKTEQDLAADIRVQGFRKGKAPLEVTRNHLDKSQVLSRALECALRESLAQLIDREHFEVRRTSDLRIAENSADVLRYSVQLHLMPQVALADLKGFKARRHPIQISEQEVQESLDALCAARAILEPKDGPAESGDRVEVDFVVRMDGKVIEGGESKSHPLVIGGKTFIPGFEDQLVGMHKDGQREFSLTAPADYFHKAVAGKKLDFSVTMKNIQRAQRPVLNDAFARSLGQFQNLDQLRGSVREGIYEEKQLREKQRVRLEILDKMIEGSKIDVPGQMVTEQLDTMVTDFDQDLHGRGLELGMYLAQLNKTQDDLRKEWRKEAERQVKISLLLQKIMNDKHISVTEQEIEEKLNDTAQTLMTRGQTDPSQINVAVLRAQVAEQLLRDKTLDFIEGVYSAS